MNQEIMNRTKWFMHDRFGMFIHWGLYSIPARGEWVLSNEKMEMEQYTKYFEQFNPSNYDLTKWAKLAKRAGMKYAVLTAKHHDGFCLFDSQLTDWKSTNTPLGKDIVRDFLEAFRAEGIKVGLYYSLLDWHHPDYPKYSDEAHPRRGDERYKDEIINFDNYLDYMHGQIEELVTNYGKLDIMWFDYSYGEMRGEKWRATKLIEMVRSHQPDIIIDNRLETAADNHGSIKSDNPLPYSGDFACPEQIIPPEGVTDIHGASVPWELCVTLNNHWGYCKADTNYKSSKLLIRTLVECVSKGGNMMLNVGPDAEGRIPDESARILMEIGEWLSRNSESIYGCGIASISKPEWGRYTQNGSKLYAHVYEDIIGSMALTGIRPEKFGNAYYVDDGSEVNRGEAWNTVEYKDVVFLSFGESPVCTYPLPDRRDTVIRVELK